MVTPTPATAATPATRILVVDDDRLVLATVTHGLTAAGYEVVDADNGDEAILLAREHRPALALLDIRMEGMTGFDVAAILRDTYRIPFMFLSAFADEQTQRQVDALGALDYLVKPLDVEQIVPRVASVLARLAAGEAPPEPRPELTAAAGAAPAAVLAAVPAAASAAVPSHLSTAEVALAAPAAPPATPAVAVAGPQAGAEVVEPSAGPVVLPCADTLALAVGVLMHRHSLDRQAAWHKLQRLADHQGLTAAAQADRLLAAVEELARTAL